MTEQKSKAIMVNSIMLIAIITAYICRFIGKGAFYPTFFTYLRGFIYIGLFTMWGIFVRQRVVQKQAKKYLTWVAVLLIFWMMVRSAKYFIFWQAAAIRYAWYLFYLPMIFVPMLALLIALSLGKPDDYRLPKAAVILWLISAALLIVVLTNDWHQLVFAFPQNTAVWTDEDYDYAFFYFVIVAYQVVCALAALLIMFSKCRIPNGARRIWPVIPLFLSLLYSVLYIIGVPELRFWFGDLTAFQSVMYIWCFELCIACGYIHSNSRYVDLFEFSGGGYRLRLPIKILISAIWLKTRCLWQ